MALQACRRAAGMSCAAMQWGQKGETACVPYTGTGGPRDASHEEWAGDRESQYMGQGALGAIYEVHLRRGADQRGRSIPHPACASLVHIQLALQIKAVGGGGPIRSECKQIAVGAGPGTKSAECEFTLSRVITIHPGKMKQCDHRMYTELCNEFHAVLPV